MILGLFVPAIVDGSTLWSRDVAVNYLPNLAYWMQRVMQGEFPHWSPYSGGGMPYAADPVQGVFYPPKLLILLIGDPVSAYNWLIAIHMFLAALGLERFLRHMELSRFSALAGALVFVLSGPVVSDSRAMQFLFALAWTPWMLDAARQYFGPRRRFAGPLLSLFSGLMLLAGEPQTFLVTWGTVLLYWVFSPVSGEPDTPRKTLFNCFAGAALWGGLGIGLAFVQWYPAWIIAQESARGVTGLSYAAAAECSYHPLRLIELLLPQVFGSDIGQMTVWTPRFSCTEQMPVFYFHSLYAGITAVALLPLAFLKTRGTSSIRNYALSLTAVSLVIAMGPFGPVDLYRLLFDWLPSWNRFRFPERLLAWSALGLAILAAVAADRWRESLLSRDRSRWYPAVTALIMLAIIVAPDWPSLFARIDPRSRAWAELVIRQAVSDGMAGAVLCLAAFAVAAWRWYRPVLIIFPLLLVLDSGVQASRILDFWPDPAFLRKEPELVSRLRDMNGSAPAPVRYGPPGLLFTPANLFGIPDAFLLAAAKNEALAIDQGILYRVSATTSGNSLKSARLDQLERRLVPVLYERLQGASVIIADRKTPFDDTRFEATVETDQVKVYRSRGNPSRVICPDKWKNIPDGEEAVRHIASPESAFDPDREAVGPLGSDGKRNESAAVCRLVSWSEEQYEIEVDQEDDAPVVLRELYTAGWTARSGDGGSLLIRPANHFHQAVTPGPGRHRIIFEYRTPGLLYGAVVTGFSGFVVLGLIFLRWKGQGAATPL